MSLFSGANAGGTGAFGGGGGFGANNNNQPGGAGSVFGAGGGFGQPAATGTLIIFVSALLFFSLAVHSPEGCVLPCNFSCLKYFRRRDVRGAS